MLKRTLITVPETAPVDVATAKQRLAIEHTNDDALLAALISEATDFVQSYLDRFLVAQTWDYFFDSFPDIGFKLPLVGVQSITHIKYVDTAGAQQTLAPGNYQSDLLGDPVRIEPAADQVWPATEAGYNKIELRLVHGYGDAANVPDGIKTGLLLLVGHLYRNREATAPITISELPFGVKSFLNLYRVYRI